MTIAIVREKMGSLAFEAIKLAMASGLTWEEAVASFGIACKAIASSASEGRGVPVDECIAHASRRFAEGMAQDAQSIEFASGTIH